MTGFTMVEILVALCFIGIAFIPILGLFISGASGTAEVTNTAAALNLASETMDILSNLPYEDLMSRYDSDTTVPVETLGTKFEMHILKPSDVPSYDGELARVEVRVTWQEKGKDKDVVLTTLVGNQRI